LDVQTISSTFAGYYPNGREKFDTIRSEVGELVYQLKYKAQTGSADTIAEMMAEHFANKPIILSHIDLVLPMPASTRRAVQPVYSIASELAKKLEKTYTENAIQKTKQTPSLKNITDAEERRDVLEGAFEGVKAQLEGKGVLLVDDLYRSGATANAVTLALIAAGASRVYFLAATRTRSNT
tara:strand:+ start:173727 stop:174269 length:543 start_codon:yes stop_codon:yes gene_type:complete